GADLIATLASAVDEAEKRADFPSVYCTAVAVDPYHWSLLHFTLWTDSWTLGGVRWEVLHLSTPQLDNLPVGQHWPASYRLCTAWGSTSSSWTSAWRPSALGMATGVARDGAGLPDACARKPSRSRSANATASACSPAGPR